MGILLELVVQLTKLAFFLLVIIIAVKLGISFAKKRNKKNDNVEK